MWRLWLFFSFLFSPREILCTPRTGFCDRSVEFCHKQKALLGLSQKTVTRLQSFKIDPGDANCSSLQVAAKLTL
jgi:hypothetical protein